MTFPRSISWLSAFLCLVLLGSLSAQLSTKPSTQKPAAHSPSSPKAATSKSAAQFVDITRAAGIDFHLTCGNLDSRYIIDSMCGGVAVFDYDNDGWMDLYFVDGSTLADLHAN